MVPSYIKIVSPAVIEQTDPFCVEGAILVSQKVVHSIQNFIIFAKMMTTELHFHFWEEVVDMEPNQEDRVGLRQAGIAAWPEHCPEERACLVSFPQ